MLTIFAASLMSNLTNALPIIGVEAPITISRFKTNPNLYFEKKYDAMISTTEWNLVAFLDLRNLKKIWSP